MLQVLRTLPAAGMHGPLGLPPIALKDSSSQGTTTGSTTAGGLQALSASLSGAWLKRESSRQVVQQIALSCAAAAAALAGHHGASIAAGFSSAGLIRPVGKALGAGLGGALLGGSGLGAETASAASASAAAAAAGGNSGHGDMDMDLT